MYVPKPWLLPKPTHIEHKEYPYGRVSKCGVGRDPKRFVKASDATCQRCVGVHYGRKPVPRQVKKRKR